MGVTSRKRPSQRDAAEVLERAAGLAERLASSAVAASLRVCAAESCSGGLLSSIITDQPGASLWFAGSVVCYGEESKLSLLGVDKALLERNGAVSGQCARALASGALRLFGADLAVALTGLAGPGGDGSNPVGTVFVSWARQVDAGTAVTCRKLHFTGGRRLVKALSVEAALEGLLEVIGRGRCGR